MTYPQTTPESLYDDAPPAKGTPDFAAGVARLERAIDKRDGKIHTDPPNARTCTSVTYSASGPNAGKLIAAAMAKDGFDTPRERHRRKLRAAHARRREG